MTRNITINSYLNIVEPPRYQHDCDQCKYRGRLEEFDVYTCDNTIIMRYSNESSEYGSYDICCMTPEYWTTNKLNSTEAAWNEKYFVLIRELYKHKFISVKISL